MKDNPLARELRRGRDGLFGCCNSIAEPIPPRGLGIEWRKTKHPATSPTVGTPAWEAWARGEAVWEAIFVSDRR